MNLPAIFREQLDLHLETCVADTYAARSLTEEETEFAAWMIDTAAAAFALTIPPATITQEKHLLLVGNKGGHNLTVVCAAGFGGLGAGDDTITLTSGEMALLFCDGTTWRYLNVITAA
jgi:hypothetical protein